MARNGSRSRSSSAGEGVRQAVATTPGETYRVTFDYTGVSGCFGGSPKSVWEVLVDGAVILTTPANPDPGWMSAEITFVAASTSTELCLRTPDGLGQGGLDNVSMTLD